MVFRPKNIFRTKRLIGGRMHVTKYHLTKEGFVPFTYKYDILKRRFRRNIHRHRKPPMSAPSHLEEGGSFRLGGRVHGSHKRHHSVASSISKALSRTHLGRL